MSGAPTVPVFEDHALNPANVKPAVLCEHAGGDGYIAQAIDVRQFLAEVARRLGASGRDSG